MNDKAELKLYFQFLVNLLFYSQDLCKTPAYYFTVFSPRPSYKIRVQYEKLHVGALESFVVFWVSTKVTLNLGHNPFQYPYTVTICIPD
jgi:hypothetical protein